jgi:hypothetical protein
MRGLTAISCVKNQSEIYFKIPSVLLKAKRLKYHASMFECQTLPNSALHIIEPIFYVYILFQEIFHGNMKAQKHVKKVGRNGNLKRW